MRNPLNSMLSMMIALSDHVSDKGRHYLEVAKTSNTLLQYLVSDMVDLFQIKSNTFISNMHNFNISTSLINLITLFSI